MQRNATQHKGRCNATQKQVQRDTKASATQWKAAQWLVFSLFAIDLNVNNIIC